MSNHGESSVEDILESIKKVIARDSRERDDLISQRRQRQRLDEQPVEPANAEEVDEVLELSGELDDGPADEANDALDDDADALTRGDTRDAMRENFAALAMMSQPGKQPQIVRQGETSLEGLVRDMLRPMLAQWLDDNLPGMVEQMVKAEIARIAGKRS
ncbi:MAG: DUF2497 domain-containing protein [Citromicrobium sp.]|nr:MAG: DUF2497 domain-containing protein [Citromicrobium sp.]